MEKEHLEKFTRDSGMALKLVTHTHTFSLSLCLTDCNLTAVKFLVSASMDEDFVQDFNKEVVIMRSLRHPNVLQVYLLLLL